MATVQYPQNPSPTTGGSSAVYQDASDKFRPSINQQRANDELRRIRMREVLHVGGGDSTFMRFLRNLKSSEPIEAMVFETNYQSAPAQRVKIASAATSSATSLTLATGDNHNLLVDDTLYVGDEVLLITAVSDTAETITVSRGYGGTAGAITANTVATIGSSTRRTDSVARPGITHKTESKKWALQVVDMAQVHSVVDDVMAQYPAGTPRERDNYQSSIMWDNREAIRMMFGQLRIPTSDESWTASNFPEALKSIYPQARSSSGIRFMSQGVASFAEDSGKSYDFSTGSAGGAISPQDFHILISNMRREGAREEKSDYDSLAEGFNTMSGVTKKIKGSDIEKSMFANSVYCFGGTAFINAVNQMYSGDLRRIVDSDSPVVQMFGTKDKLHLQTFGGRDVIFCYEPSFDNSPRGEDWSKNAIIINPDLVGRKHLRGFEEIQRENIGYPAQRSYWDEKLTISGLCCKGSAHDYIVLKNVTSGQKAVNSNSPVALSVTT